MHTSKPMPHLLFLFQTFLFCFLPDFSLFSSCLNSALEDTTFAHHSMFSWTCTMTCNQGKLHLFNTLVAARALPSSACHCINKLYTQQFLKDASASPSKAVVQSQHLLVFLNGSTIVSGHVRSQVRC